MKNLRACGLLLALALVVPSLAAAVSLPAGLAKDFKPLAGRVVGHQEKEWLIDVGRDQGVHQGDLFSVVLPGPPVVDPQTGKELGRPLRITGLLQVTWVQARFSNVRKVNGAVQVGARLRRFEGVTAGFVDRTVAGEKLFLQVREALNNLRWQGYRSDKKNSGEKAPEGTQLVFILSQQGLEVRGPDRQLLHQYSLPEQAAASAPGAAVLGANSPVTVRPASSTYGYRDLGDLPGPVVAASFLRRGDRLFLAVSDGRKWQILDVSGAPAEVAHSESAMAGKVLGMHWWQPSEKGPVYLAVTRQVEDNAAGNPALGQQVQSNLFRLNGNRLVRVRAVLSGMVGSFDLDGDGRPETLLGQDLDRDITFGGQIRKFTPAGKGIEATRADLSLPLGFPVLGGTLCRWGALAQLRAVWVRSRTLFIARKGKPPFQMEDKMGGSLLTLTYDVNPGAADRMFQTVPLEVPPVCAVLDGDGRPELVTVASERSLFHLADVKPNIRHSWLTAVSDDNGRHHTRKLGPVLDGAIQGLASDHGRLLLVTTDLNDENASRLLVLEKRGGAGGH